MFSHEIYSLTWSLKKRLRTTSIILLLLSLIEHVFSLISFLYDRYIQATKCKYNIDSYAYYLLTNQMGHIFAEVPINVFTSIWAEYTNIRYKSKHFHFANFS